MYITHNIDIKIRYQKSIKLVVYIIIYDFFDNENTKIYKQYKLSSVF